MESILWALDLFVVVYLCIWALKQEKSREKAEEKERKNA
jgi:hypothetical protein